MADSIRICRADYSDPHHAEALIRLLDAYACDPMGGGEGLSDFAKTHVVRELAQLPHAFSVLAFDGADDRVPVGLANCFRGFSTFACKPLVNVHDLTVLPGYRGQRIGERMLAFVEVLAREMGACKLTLEVLSGNASAMRLYARAGFSAYELDPAAGQASLLQKWLS